MRENRPYGSEGGEAKAFPTPIRDRDVCALVRRTVLQTFRASRTLLATTSIAGSPRFARDDGVDGPTLTASSAKTWSLERHQRGDRP